MRVCYIYMEKENEEERARACACVRVRDREREREKEREEAAVFCYHCCYMREGNTYKSKISVSFFKISQFQ